MQEQLITLENMDAPRSVRYDQVVWLEVARLEQYPKFQSDYKYDVITLVGAFEPFLRTQQRATGLEPDNLHAPRCGRRCKKVEDNGLQPYTAFLDTKVISQEVTSNVAMHKTNLKLFRVIKTNKHILHRFCLQRILVTISTIMYSPLKASPLHPLLL